MTGFMRKSLLVLCVCFIVFLLPRGAKGQGTENLKRYKIWNASASSWDGADKPGRAIDNNLATRWTTPSADKRAWIAFDLHFRKNIDTIVIAWEAANARVYRIQISDDKKNWRTVFKQHQGKSGMDLVRLTHHVRAQYIRLLCTQKALKDCGYSIYEFQVFGEQ